MTALYAATDDRLELVGHIVDLLHASMAGRWLHLPDGFSQLYAVELRDDHGDRAERVELRG